MDVESVARLLPSGSVYAFLAEHRRELFPDEMFADLFPSRLGRPSVPGDVVASVLVLQALEGRSDREAVEALTFDLRWKAACGLAVAAAGFHPTVLGQERVHTARRQQATRHRLGIHHHMLRVGSALHDPNRSPPFLTDRQTRRVCSAGS